MNDSVMCSILTASVRGKLPEIQIFQGKVDKSGQFAGSDASFWEALQIWAGEAVREKTLKTDSRDRPPGSLSLQA